MFKMIARMLNILSGSAHGAAASAGYDEECKEEEDGEAC